ncbi:MAG: ABC transporter permease [Christensenellales bacterium]
MSTVAKKTKDTVFNSSSMRKRVFNNIWLNRYIYMMVVPVLIYMVLFKYLPMYFLRASLYDFKLLKGFEGSKFVGLKWFERMLSSPELWRYIRNTLTLNSLSLLICFPMPMIFALLLNEVRNKPYKKIVQTVSYMPHFISTVVLVSMINNILSPSLGTLAKIYKLLGKTPINFLSNPDYFYGINIVSGVWQTVGWNAIIYISAISSIDQTLYEAARIDGANRWKQTLYVTIPGVLPTFVLLLIMQIGQMLNCVFDKIYLLQNTLNLQVSEMLPTYIYKVGIESQKYGLATAGGLFNSVLSVILVLIANSISKKVSEISLF